MEDIGSEDACAIYSQVALEVAAGTGAKTKYLKKGRSVGADAKVAFANVAAYPSRISFAGIITEEEMKTGTMTNRVGQKTQERLFIGHFKLINIAARLVVNIALPQLRRLPKYL